MLGGADVDATGIESDDGEGIDAEADAEDFFLAWGHGGLDNNGRAE